MDSTLSSVPAAGGSTLAAPGGMGDLVERVRGGGEGAGPES